MQNAFSDRFQPIPGFNIFDMFVVDLMHEVELEVWRSLFMHLISIPGISSKALIALAQGN